MHMFHTFLHSIIHNACTTYFHLNVFLKLKEKIALKLKELLLGF